MIGSRLVAVRTPSWPSPRISDLAWRNFRFRHLGYRRSVLTTSRCCGKGRRSTGCTAPAGRHPTSWDELRVFGPLATARFDHHPPPARVHPDLAVGYAALDIRGALAEAFQDGRVIDRHRDDPWLAAFDLVVDTPLLDLRGLWPTRAGASQAISSGPRDRARAWSRSIHRAYPTVNGLIYPSSMAGRSTNIALYERAADAFPAHPALNIPLRHPGILSALNREARALGYGLR